MDCGVMNKGCHGSPCCMVAAESGQAQLGGMVAAQCLAGSIAGLIHLRQVGVRPIQLLLTLLRTDELVVSHAQQLGTRLALGILVMQGLEQLQVITGNFGQRGNDGLHPGIVQITRRVQQLFAAQYIEYHGGIDIRVILEQRLKLRVSMAAPSMK